MIECFSKMNVDEVKYWVGFSLIPGIGPARFSLLESYFGSLEKAWYASANELRAAGLDSRSVGSILEKRSEISLDDEMGKVAKYNVGVLTWNDAGYPSRLKEIYDRPPVLYVRGSLVPEDTNALAVVGSRRASVYGRQVVEDMVTELARYRITIVSGLAKGIDAVAHQAALKAGGRTIAVFGCGLDMVYPSDHASIARRIMEQGALVSEFPLGTRPRADNFPRRNRIMSGISLGVLVVEAGESSGALITAHQAVEQNREVFAVPGNIFSPFSKGTNRLIQEGAKLVRNCTDILEELNLSLVAQQLELKEFAQATDTESRLLSCLSHEASHIDEICRCCGLPISVVSGTLTMLELKGLARHLGGMNYARV